ncbi:MAG TPA: hypothetical protein VFG45_07345 [Candidatus Nitrosocosmicus sp.]|nr:hypothetical protein [Candidatus Nitrosocosmicus sp. SS]HET6589959.1 hypothetical protein [Candidatus Nitrosocosmicus sp.]
MIISSRNDVISMLEKDAVNILSESAYGKHNLVIYSTYGDLRDFT